MRLRPAQGGFTLLELLIALALLGMMLVLLYSALNFSIRAWDTGDARAEQAARQRIVLSFLRRNLAQIFPVRWRGIPESKIAFQGDKRELRFVSTLNVVAGDAMTGGLQWGLLSVADDEKEGKHFSSLFLKRGPFDNFAKDWSGLDDAKPIRLLEGVKEFELDYFGAENDMAEPKWEEKWDNPLRMPQLVRLRIKLDNGRDLPEIVVAIKVGEEAGCYESNFQRRCGPRRA